jgi:predicted ATPase/DNA-binding CsgD family transcriptional regulator
MDHTAIRSVLEPLTDRELEVLRLIDEGLSNRDIARQLVVTLETVKWYNKQIYGKLGVHTRTQAVAKAREAGLFDVRPKTPAPPTIAPKHNLPTQVTSFVGREREMAEIGHLLATARVLTLTGPPGTGKTRLALEVAAQTLDRFKDGTFLVDLAPIADPQLLLGKIAQTLGVREITGQPLAETLKAYLREKRLLLLLDNFEQIIAAAPLVGDLLSALPGLKVLATSREALRIYAEQEYQVPPLALPDIRHVEPLPTWLHYEAVQLFTQRAQAVKPDFAITAANVAAVAEICVRLDGLPLAIELAAARSKLLSPEMMRMRLESRLGTLVSGPRDLPARLRTLRGTLDWSYELLDEGEKSLLARLTVFQGGRTLEAAEMVCGPGLPVAVLDGLESLLNKSLLRQREDPEGQPRFYMLETVREYAREKLEESGEADELRSRHAEYFVGLAEQAEPQLRGADQGYWCARLRSEHDNLRNALAWALAGARVEWGLRLVGALRDFWYYEGHIAEGLRWTQRALEEAGDAPAALRAKALNTAGWLAFAQGDNQRGKVWNGQALSLYRELGDKVNTAWALVFLGAHSLGSPDEYRNSIALSAEGLALFRSLDHQPGMAQALNGLGEAARLDGDYERAAEAYEECLAISRAIGDKQREAIMLGNLGYIAQHRGDYERAEALSKAALALLWERQSAYLIAFALATLAGPVTAKGDPERAARLLGASAALFEALGTGPQPVDQPEIDQYIAALRTQLDGARFGAAWAEGRALSLDEAVSYALGERV